MRIMTRTSCLGLQHALLSYSFEEEGDPFDYLPSLCWTSCQKSLHEQPFLDYFWDCLTALINNTSCLVANQTIRRNSRVYKH